MRKQKILYLILAVVLAGMLLGGCLSGPGSGSENSSAEVFEDNVSSETVTAEADLTAAGSTETVVSAGPIRFNGTEATYTIVYDKDFVKKERQACQTLNEHLGGALAVTADEDKDGAALAESEYEILVGVTNRAESGTLAKGLGEFDYRIAVEDEKLVIVGGSSSALFNAIAELIRSEEFADGTLERDFSLSFDGADSRDEYIANPDLFLCNWALEFDVPDWMLDFEEKLAAFADPEGRMMSSAHRGDSINYPENSIEGIISAVKMGADNIELDVRLTKDGVPVLMHDETLQRTTDWREKAGKNGLPESANLCDWTFEELRQLRLAADSGDEHEYLIPTLEEALLVCSGRTTIRLDKFNAWDWDENIYPLIQKTGAWQTVILNFHFSAARQEEIIAEVKAESGLDIMRFYAFQHEKCAEWPERAESVAGQDSTVIAIWRDLEIRQIERYVEEAEPYLSQVKGLIRIYADAHFRFGGEEDPEEWDYLYEVGVDVVVADNVLGVQQYIAENYAPAEH